MKRVVLIVMGIIIATYAMAQKKIAKVPEIQTVKKEALAWFKNSYVENNFKDPYSYKLLKADIYPQTYKESLQSDIKRLNYFTIDNDTAGKYGKYQVAIRDYTSELHRHQERFPTADTSDKKFQNSLRYVNYRKSEVDNMLKAYLDANQSIKDCENKLATSSPSALSKIVYYSVYLDCYSNNSYGNPVLGRFSFHYGKQGLVREPIQLNKE